AALRPDACSAEISCCHAAADGLMVRVRSRGETCLADGERQSGQSQQSDGLAGKGRYDRYSPTLSRIRRVSVSVTYPVRLRSSAITLIGAGSPDMYGLSDR